MNTKCIDIEMKKMGYWNTFPTFSVLVSVFNCKEV